MVKLLKRDVFSLFLITLLFNFGLALLISAPSYLDDAYYYGGAVRLAQGQGFSEPYLWHYLDNPTALPRPSHLYWLPLTSIVSALPMLVLGQNFLVARLPFILLASLLPVISYLLAQQFLSSRFYAFISALLTLFSGFYALMFVTSDSFALYGVIGALTLLALAKAVSGGNRRWWFLAGLGAGLAHLTRADGVLLMLVGLYFLWKYSSHFTSYTLFFLFGYLLFTSLWFVRNFALTGSPLGASGASTLWLVQYDDMFIYPSNVTFARYLQAGLTEILRGKFFALTNNLQTFIAVQCFIFLTPFVLIGVWHLRRTTLMQIVMLYAILLYGAMTFAFSLVGARGGLFHSSAALLPFVVCTALVGLDQSIAWIAQRRASWNVAQAQKVFGVALVTLALILTIFITYTRLQTWHIPYDQYLKLQPYLPAGAVVLSNNPPLVWLATNRGGAMIPSGDEQMLRAVAAQFNAEYVLLDQNHVPALTLLYTQERSQNFQLIAKWNQYKLFFVKTK